MSHLTTDEIIDFVSFRTLNGDSLKLAAKVNAHLLQCAECFERVRAYQAEYDAAQDFTDNFTEGARDTELPAGQPVR